MNLRVFVLFVSPLLLIAAGLGFLAADARARPDPTLYWSDDIVREMRTLVEKSYVDEVSPEQARELFYAACKAYLQGLDAYCEFYTPDERRAMEQETQGEFGGVGILGASTREGILIRGARRGDPAWAAGIRAGDHIVSVDGHATTGDQPRDVLRRLRGEPGTAVRVAWRPAAGGDVREAEVVRSRVKIDSVLGVQVLDPAAGVGYLRISRFQENTAADVKEAVRRLLEKGARSLIVDLRSDYGGVLPAAVAVADGFLSGGRIVVTRGRGGVEKGGHAAGPDPDDLLDIPLVLLVDGNTASASEILAGALQDHRRAVLVGERTYGKFLVQRIVPVGEEGVALRLTTARYYTPFGRNLQRDDARGVRGGIVPDVPVEIDEAMRAAVDRAFDDQQGLDWDLVPGAGAPPLEDPILEKGLAMLRDLASLAADPPGGEGGEGGK